MATLKEEALAYQPKQTKNISDLPECPISVHIMTDTGKNDDGKEFTYKYFELNGERYRVPQSVLNSLKVILTQNPNMSKFKVIRSGSGMGTEYTVIPLM